MRARIDGVADTQNDAEDGLGDIGDWAVLKIEGKAIAALGVRVHAIRRAEPVPARAPKLRSADLQPRFAKPTGGGEPSAPQPRGFSFFADDIGGVLWPVLALL